MRPFGSIHLIRTYASTARRSRLPKAPLSLDHFLLRQRVLGFYRTIVRSCFKLPGSTRREMIQYARGEFELRREETDLRKIRYLMSTGKADFDRLRGQMGGGLGR